MGYNCFYNLNKCYFLILVNKHETKFMFHMLEKFTYLKKLYKIKLFFSINCLKELP